MDDWGVGRAGAGREVVSNGGCSGCTGQRRKSHCWCTSHGPLRAPTFNVEQRIQEEEWKREHSQALVHAGRWRVMLACWAPNMSGDNRRGSSGARTTGDKKAPQSHQASGLRGRSSPEKMSFSFITLTSRLDLPTVALSMICSGL